MRLIRAKKKVKNPTPATLPAETEVVPYGEAEGEPLVDGAELGAGAVPDLDVDLDAEFEAEADLPKQRPASSTASRSLRRDEAGHEESLFRRYLRDVSSIDVMAPEQEFALARRIESLKIDMWMVILRFVPAAPLVIECVEANMPERWKGYDVYKRSVARGAKSGAAFERKVKAWAEAASAADPEGIFLELLADYLLGRPAPVTKRIKGFANYAESVRVARRRMRDAKNYFVKANLRLVLAVAARYSRELLSFEDLVQEGNIGLMKAVDRYDYRRGFRFSTYASWWIRHAIGRALADKARLVRLPVHVLDSQQKIEKTRRKLLAQLGRKPSPEEISEATGLPVEEVQRIINLPPSNPVSLDEPFADDDDGRSRLESLADPDPEPEPIDRMESNEKETAMLRLLGTLKPVEVDILRKRFGLHDGRERTLQEIGDEHSLSRERIRQVQDRALSKLRLALTRDFSGEGSQLFG